MRVCSPLEEFLSLRIPEDWHIQPGTRQLGGEVTQLVVAYTRRPDVTLTEQVEDDIHQRWEEVATTLSLWWYTGPEEFVVNGDRVTEYTAETQERAEHRLREAMGVTRAQAESRWIALACTGVEGIGPVTVQRLHEQFGTIDAIAHASHRVLQEIPNITPRVVDEIQERICVDPRVQGELSDWAEG